MIGMPYSRSISSPTATSRAAHAGRSCRRPSRHAVVEIGVGAVEQADAERDRADVEVLHLHHADGFEDLLRGELDGHVGIPGRARLAHSSTRSRRSPLVGS